MKLRRLILVTGAPRTATTPVGNLLAQCQGAVSLYEPLGPTGLAAIREPFPIVGDGLGIEPDDLEPLLRDLKSLRLGELRPQTRGGGTASLRGRLVGTRTLHSVRLARLQPWSRTVIWKDPHAILMVPDLVETDVDVVVTARTPWAHAASYKRLGWRSKAAEVYPRWSRKFGPCAVCEKFIDRCADKVISAALLWRLSYLPLVRTNSLERVHLVTSDALERDERATYRRLLDALGLSATRGVQRTLGAPRREAAVSDMRHKAHDWNRSLASLNRYWQDVLSEEDLTNIRAITEDLVPAIAGSVEIPQLVAAKN
jgi:hypothetical protein